MDKEIQVQNTNKGMIEVAQSRQAQEVQAAMTVAKRFPRDGVSAVSRIIQACKRPGLAEAATYVYPRGGTKVAGPSIRLAEALAQNWGNIDFGVIELSQGTSEQGVPESTVLSYAWDLETNTRQTKIFTVPHLRYTKQGTRLLNDPRDIYEIVANQGARRLRACILGIIPGDIVDIAVAECEKTLAGSNDKPLEDRLRGMIESFTKYGVTQPMIESYLGHNLAATSEQELVRLRGVYTSLKDGMSSREDHFDITADRKDEPSDNTDIAAKVRNKVKKGNKSKDDSQDILGEINAIGKDIHGAQWYTESKVYARNIEKGAENLLDLSNEQLTELLTMLKEASNENI